MEIWDHKELLSEYDVHQIRAIRAKLKAEDEAHSSLEDYAGAYWSHSPEFIKKVYSILKDARTKAAFSQNRSAKLTWDEKVNVVNKMTPVVKEMRDKARSHIKKTFKGAKARDLLSTENIVYSGLAHDLNAINFTSFDRFDMGRRILNSLKMQDAVKWHSLIDKQQQAQRDETTRISNVKHRLAEQRKKEYHLWLNRKVAKDSKICERARNYKPLDGFGSNIYHPSKSRGGFTNAERHIIQTRCGSANQTSLEKTTGYRLRDFLYSSPSMVTKFATYAERTAYIDINPEWFLQGNAISEDEIKAAQHALELREIKRKTAEEAIKQKARELKKRKAEMVAETDLKRLKKYTEPIDEYKSQTHMLQVAALAATAVVLFI